MQTGEYLQKYCEKEKSCSQFIARKASSVRFNKWCRSLSCVAKNDCGHVKHCNLAWI